MTQHFGDTATYDFPVAEFYFIDGAHTYEYARNDTEKALRSTGAKTLMWHDSDAGHHGVTRWLAEMIRSGYPVRQIQDTNLAILDLQNHVALGSVPSETVQASVVRPVFIITERPRVVIKQCPRRSAEEFDLSPAAGGELPS